MELSSEDTLKLHVLIAGEVFAIRINESSMTLKALTDQGELAIPLNPTTSDDKYLKLVREFLSEHYLGMPGGYPLHLGRWTRLRSTRNSLDKMLLLGEPEAVVAATCSPGVTAEIANRSWWCVQSAEVARHLLQHQVVIDSALGPELTTFLLEFIPFEADPCECIESISLCLGSGLLPEESVADLWSRASRKSHYYTGFLLAGAKSIPVSESDHPFFADALTGEPSPDLKSEPYNKLLRTCLSASGRTWLRTLRAALRKPPELEVVAQVFVAIERFLGLPELQRGPAKLEQIVNRCGRIIRGEEYVEGLSELVLELPSQMAPLLEAALILSSCRESCLDDSFRGHESRGSVMRKKLAPLSDVVEAQITQLLTDPQD